MKAIQIKQTGGPEVMELVDLPVPQPKPNEAVVKIAAAGVNFIDVYNREGRYKARCRWCWDRKRRAWFRRWDRMCGR
jgi:NADPH:quinone reductase-like Zn-dependent oxidoreductase